MTQNVIRQNYIQYLRFQAEENPSVDQEAIAALIADLEEGYCFGFSASHAIYGVFGYDNWWEHSQAGVNNWDGKLASLQNETRFCDYLPRTHVPAPNSSKTLQDTLEQSLNNTVSLQLGYRRRKPEFHEEKFTQYNLLKPKNKFSVLINNELRCIQDWDRVCRHFTLSELSNFLENNKQEIAGNACFVYSHDHLIDIKYKKNTWIIYNPNYNHHSPREMTKKFKSNRRAAREIFRVLETHDIGFDVATFKKGRSVSLKRNKMTPREARRMLRETGLHMIAEHSKNCLAQIVEMAEQDKKVKKAVIKGLRKRDVQNTAGLSYVIVRAPAVFSRVLKLACHDKDYASVIRDFFQKNPAALKMIVEDAPSAVPRLLVLAANDSILRIKITAALLERNESGCLLIEIIEQKNHLLAQLFKLADTHKDVELGIALALVIKDPQGLSGFEILLKSSPDGLGQLISRAHSSPLIAHQLARLLRQQGAQKRTGLQQLLLYAPALLPCLLKLTTVNIVIRTALATALVEKSGNGRSGLLYMARYAGDALPQLFRLAARDPAIAAAIAESLIQRNSKNRTGLESLLKKKPDILPHLLILAGNSKDVHAAFRVILEAMSKEKRAQLFAILVEKGISGEVRSRGIAIRIKNNPQQMLKLVEELITINTKKVTTNKKSSLRNHSLFQTAVTCPFPSRSDDKRRANKRSS